MRWFVLPEYKGNDLIAVEVAETDKGIISCAFVITFDTEIPEHFGLKNYCGGELLNSGQWQVIPYDVFNSFGGDTNNREIRLVEGGYIGRDLTRPQKIKLPEGYCKSCAEAYNLWDRPIVGTDKKLYCNKCLKPFRPIPFKVK
jgi:hypothetical protein